MEISDVRLKLVTDPNDRLRAVCSVTFDDEFVVRDLKVVQGANGLFVAMPSRKLSSHCAQCGHKNHVRAVYCNDCGSKLPANRASGDASGRVRLHRDVAHPICPAFREKIQRRVIERYEQEMELASDPNYEPEDIDAEFEEAEEVASAERETKEPVEATPQKREKSFDFADYDALIAGLRSGATRDDSIPPAKSYGASAQAEESRRVTESPSRGRDREEPRGGAAQGRGRDQGRNQRSGKHAHEDPSRKTPDSQPPRSRPRSEVRPRESTPLANQPLRGAEQNAGVPPTPPAPAPAQKNVNRADSPVSPPRIDEDTPFGAGIL